MRLRARKAMLGRGGIEDRSRYICIIYTPNLGLGIAILGQEREQGRFRGSSEGARGSNEGARGSTMGSAGGAAKGSLNWLPCTLRPPLPGVSPSPEVYCRFFRYQSSVQPSPSRARFSPIYDLCFIVLL